MVLYYHLLIYREKLLIRYTTLLKQLAVSHAYQTDSAVIDVAPAALPLQQPVVKNVIKTIPIKTADAKTFARIRKPHYLLYLRHLLYDTCLTHLTDSS
jgi:hypothetical protein